MPTSHIEEDLLDQYAMGTLPGVSIAEVEEHLLLCQLCQKRLQETDELLPLFRAAATQVLSSPPREAARLWPFRRALWAGAAAVAVAAMVIFIPGELPNSNAPPPVVQMRSLRGPDAGAGVAAGKPSLLAFDVAIPAAPAEFEIEIVTTEGRAVLKADAKVSDGQLTALAGKLARGSYWVRVYRKQAERELVAEYSLRAQ